LLTVFRPLRRRDDGRANRIGRRRRSGFSPRTFGVLGIGWRRKQRYCGDSQLNWELSHIAIPDVRALDAAIDFGTGTPGEGEKVTVSSLAGPVQPGLCRLQQNPE
jgi:hypothetical protein